MLISGQLQTIHSPIRVLHLSDLHFGDKTQWEADLDSLEADIQNHIAIQLVEIDYLVVSGDFANINSGEGFDKAYDFICRVMKNFGVSSDKCVIVPGNHDINEYSNEYSDRFKTFNEKIYRKIYNRDFPTDKHVGMNPFLFNEDRIQFIPLNSCSLHEWVSEKKRYVVKPSVDKEARADTIRKAHQDIDYVHLKQGDVLKIAVMHHPAKGFDDTSDRLIEAGNVFLKQLVSAGVKVVLHGDIHKDNDDQYLNIEKQDDKVLQIVGAGSFGSPLKDLPNGRMYTLLEIDRGLETLRVRLRHQTESDGCFGPYAKWLKSQESDTKTGQRVIDL